MLDAWFQDLGWREKAALESFPSLFSKEASVSLSFVSPFFCVAKRYLIQVYDTDA